jgi:hypothetical protein
VVGPTALREGPPEVEMTICHSPLLDHVKLAQREDFAVPLLLPLLPALAGSCWWCCSTILALRRPPLRRAAPGFADGEQPPKGEYQQDRDYNRGHNDRNGSAAHLSRNYNEGLAVGIKIRTVY